VQFWAAIAAGRSSEEAGRYAQVSGVVGIRWFREAGGMPPSHLSPSAPPLSGRYLAFTEREQIALLRAKGYSVRAIARELDWGLDDLARVVPQRRHPIRRFRVPSDERAVARRSRGVSPKGG